MESILRYRHYHRTIWTFKTGHSRSFLSLFDRKIISDFLGGEKSIADQEMKNALDKGLRRPVSEKQKREDEILETIRITRKNSRQALWISTAAMVISIVNSVIKIILLL